MTPEEDRYVALDLETTGLSPWKDRILEIGAMKIEGGEVTATFETLIDPGIPIPERITELTGISDDMVRGCPDVSSALSDFLAFAGDFPLLGHNLSFDYGFVRQNASRMGIDYTREGLDTLRIARSCLPELDGRSLDKLSRYYGITQEHHHRALDDALTAARLFVRLAEDFRVQRPELFVPCEMCVRVKKESPATPAQIRYLTSLLRQYEIGNEIRMEVLTRNEASRIIDRILSGNRQL